MAPLLGILSLETKHKRALETLTSSAIATFEHSKPLRVSNQAGNKNKTAGQDAGVLHADAALLGVRLFKCPKVETGFRSREVISAFSRKGARAKPLWA